MLFLRMQDKFLTGWGCADGKKSLLIFKCENLEELNIVKENAKNRTDMIKIYQVSKIYKYYNKHHLEVVDKKSRYKNWYKKGYFKKQ